MSTEKFLPPKEISDALAREHGLRISAEYVRAIRRETITRGDRLFVCGMARPGAVLVWLESNPSFAPFQRSRPSIA